MSEADMEFEWDEGVNIKYNIPDYQNIIDILIQGHPEYLDSKPTTDVLCLDLAMLFLNCNEPFKSLVGLKRAMRLLTEMLPFTVLGLEGSLEYEKDGEHIFALEYYLAETIGIIKQIELLPGQDKRLITLTETLKNDIALWRAKTGI